MSLQKYLIMKTACILTLALITCSAQLQAQRYLNMVFEEVDVQTDIIYGANYTILTVPATGHTSKQNLLMDVYSPSGDTETNRPLLLFLHAGNFLPLPANSLTTGTRTDSFAVEICTRLARMGYVTASVDYRLGWNLLASDPAVAKSTLVHAIYRGMQDARTCARYFRKTVVEQNNPFGICPDKITLMGDGMGGGFIALAASVSGSYPDWLIPKLIGPDIDGDGFPDPIILQPVTGDPFGETITGFSPFNGDTLAVPNHPGFDSDVQLCVNLGGALPDTTWIDAGDPPVISFHVPNDPFVPYKDDFIVIHPGTIIIELQGSYLVAQKANLTGANQVFTNANIQDEFTIAANNHNDGYEGLFPFLRPGGVNPFVPGSIAYENAPWAWWNAAYWSTIAHPNCSPSLPLPECNFHIINAINNNDMSAEKGRTYTDSIIGYFAPRAYAALSLGSSCLTKTNELDTRSGSVSIAPNPASGLMRVSSKNGLPIQRIQLFNLSGQLVKNVEGVNEFEFSLDWQGLPTGFYIASVHFRTGVLSKKILLKK